jgi:two-component system, NarL family, response regulator DevR
MTNGNDARFRVFVVEDHPFMRRSLVDALERDPQLCVCGEADNADAALAAIPAARPDVVLTDLELRDSSGLELIRALRQRANFVPVVAITMFDLERNEHAARSAGATEFVAKQFGPGRLVETVRRALPVAQP